MVCPGLQASGNLGGVGMRKARTIRLDVDVWEALKRRSRERGLTITDCIEAVLCRELGVVPEYGYAGFGDEAEPEPPVPETPEPEGKAMVEEAMAEDAGGEDGLRLVPFILPVA